MARVGLWFVLSLLVVGSLGTVALRGSSAPLGGTVDPQRSLARAGGPAVGGSPASVDWPTYLDNPERTGANLLERTIAPSNVSHLEALWTVPSNGSDFSAPIVVNGTVYFGSWNGYEYAVDAANGSVEWSRYLGTSACAWGSPIGISSTPAFLNGTLYLGGGDGYWYALNATNGSVEWRYFVGLGSDGYYDWASALVYRDSLYIGVASCVDSPLVFGQLLEVNLTGNHSASHTFDVVPPGQLGGSIWTTPAVDPVANVVWVSTGNENPGSGYPPYPNSIVALNATTLAVLGHWQVPGVQGLDSDFGSTPTLLTTASGTPEVVATDKNGVAYALNRSNLTNGSWAPTWSLSTGGGLSSGAFDGRTVYLGGGALYAVDPGSGNVSWNTSFPDPIIGALAWANGLVYAGAGSEVAAVDASNGTVLWNYTFPSGESVVAEPVVADGHLYAVGGDHGILGELVAFGLPFTANATATPAGGPSPLPVNFTAAAEGGLTPYSYSWEFGDGSTGSGPAPTHVYLSTGNFTARVWVNDSANGTMTRGFLVTVGPPLFNPNLTAVISASGSAGVRPFTVYLNGSERNGTLPPYIYRWDFGDGTGFTGPNAVHSYLAAGTFTVTLEVNDSAHHTAETTRVEQVVDPLQATVDASPPNVTAGQPVDFAAISTGGLAPISFNWTFADGSAGASGASTSHVFGSPGNYTVRLVAEDRAGERATATVSVAVTAAVSPITASPSFAYIGGGGCPPVELEVQFTANASGGVAPLTDRWAFNDGTTAEGPIVDHPFLIGLVGNLTVNDSRGQVDHASVAVGPPPPSVGLPCPSALTGPGWVVIGAGLGLVGILVLATAAYLVVRRRRRSPVGKGRSPPE